MVVNGKSGRNYDTDKKEAETKLRYPLKAGLCFLYDQKIKIWYSSIHLEIPDHFFQSGAEWY